MGVRNGNVKFGISWIVNSVELSGTLLFVFLILGTLNLNAQFSFEDGCLLSGGLLINEEFQSSESVVNVKSADILEWDGQEWIGGFDSNEVTIEPQENVIGCRVVFLGDAQLWTWEGEAFALKLTSILEQGVKYSFDFAYVSHGKLSNGDFVPIVYGNSIPSLEDAIYIDSLPSAGYDWVQNRLSFVCTSELAGAEWMIIYNGINGTTGLISAFCPECQTCDEPLDLGEDLELCLGSDTILKVDYPSAVNFEWNDGSIEEELQITSSGTYSLSLETNLCRTSDEIVVHEIDIPNPLLREDGFLCADEHIELVSGYPNALNIWEDGSMGETHAVQGPGRYWVDVYNACGHGVDSVNFECEKVTLPNIFTPNGDGLNDQFRPELSEGVFSFNFSVFDRWGNELFRSKTEESTWDGTTEGNDCAEGVYFWVVQYTSELGRRKSITGNVTLKR